MFAMNFATMIHPGHGMPAGHLHGAEPLAIFLLLVCALAGVCVLTGGGK